MSITQRPELLRLPPTLETQLHGFRRRVWAIKMTEAAGMNNRRLFAAMMLAAVAAIIATFWIDLSLIYKDGATSRLSGFRLWVGSGSF
ncbi:MAG: hypothetical protein GY953_38585, partial [bacterium]|nr:hypothetical protein [bacterium]